MWMSVSIGPASLFAAFIIMALLQLLLLQVLNSWISVYTQMHMLFKK